MATRPERDRTSKHDVLLRSSPSQGEREHWSPLGFAEEQAVYRRPTQNARALTEGWAAAHLFCPACGADRLRQLPNNSPVGDFVCDACAEEFELKAKGGKLGPKILDGAYGAMMRRLSERNNPSLFAMSYDRAASAVTDLIVVPRHFFTPDIIEKKNPTHPKGRSNPWIGCHILIGQVPLSGRIPLITGAPTWPRARCWTAGAPPCSCAMPA